MPLACTAPLSWCPPAGSKTHWLLFALLRHFRKIRGHLHFAWAAQNDSEGRGGTACMVHWDSAKPTLWPTLATLLGCHIQTGGGGLHYEPVPSLPYPSPQLWTADPSWRTVLSQMHSGSLKAWRIQQLSLNFVKLGNAHTTEVFIWGYYVRVACHVTD